MGYSPEQLGNSRWVRIGRKSRRYLKRAVTRWRRRAERALLEDAPKKRYYRGWAD